MINLLGMELKVKREYAGLTQAMIAEFLGININTVGAYERGDRLPEVDFLIGFCDKTKATFSELMDLRIKSSPLFSEASIKHLNESNQNAAKQDDTFAMHIGQNTAPQKRQAISSSKPQTAIAMSVNNVGNIREMSAEINEALLSKCISICEKHHGKEFNDANTLEKFKQTILIYNKLIRISNVFDNDLTKLTSLGDNDLLTLLEMEGKIEEFFSTKVRIISDRDRAIPGAAPFF